MPAGTRQFAIAFGSDREARLSQPRTGWAAAATAGVEVMAIPVDARSSAVRKPIHLAGCRYVRVTAEADVVIATAPDPSVTPIS